jgi:hypothetical protein
MEIAMDRLDDDRALANSRRHPLDRARADVADRVDPRPRQPAAHCVFGSAPIMTKTLVAGRVVSLALSRSVQVTLRRLASPARAVISECG